MAWTDQCKMSAVQTIDVVVKDMGVSVRKAISEVSREADIPAATLQRRYYPREKSEVKNDPTPKPQPIEKKLLGHSGPIPKQKTTKDQPLPRVEPFSTAKQFSWMAISQLTRIDRDDPRGVDALREVIAFCQTEIRKREA